MNLNFKDVLSSVLGAGRNKANEFQGTDGRIAKGLTRGRSNRQYERADERLQAGDKKFIRHDEQLKDHERRITNLEERNK